VTMGLPGGFLLGNPRGRDKQPGLAERSGI
jgi:hypothetical protein